MDTVLGVREVRAVWPALETGKIRLPPEYLPALGGSMRGGHEIAAEVATAAGLPVSLLAGAGETAWSHPDERRCDHRGFTGRELVPGSPISRACGSYIPEPRVGTSLLEVSMSAGLGFGSPGWVSATGDAAEVQMLRVIAHGGGRGLHLVGEIDFSCVGVLEAALEAAATTTSDAGDVRLDMSEVGFVDVAGTRALLRAARRLEGRGRLVLHRPPRVLMMVMEFFPDAHARLDVIPR